MNLQSQTFYVHIKKQRISILEDGAQGAYQKLVQNIIT